MWVDSVCGGSAAPTQLSDYTPQSASGWGSVYTPSAACKAVEATMVPNFNTNCNWKNNCSSGGCSTSSCAGQVVAWAQACYPGNSYQPGTAYNGPTTGTGVLPAVQNWFHLGTTAPPGYETVYPSSACQAEADTLAGYATSGQSVLTDAEKASYSGACYQKIPWADTTEGKAVIYIGGGALLLALIYVAILRAK
jgi:hypothetical protein